MIEKTGIASEALINGAYPDEERRARGAFAVIECFQRIPCNPCSSSCIRGAILPMENINDLPRVDFEKCNGCGVCMTVCPGLAIFIIDETYSVDETLIKLPYEFLPLPDKGGEVFGVDRAGNVLCKARVVNVTNANSKNRTPIVWLAVPKQFSRDVRFFTYSDACVEGRKNACGDCGCTPVDSVNESAPEEYVCRCEGVTVREIREYIERGYATLDEIKRVCRAGMGACQGRTCRQLIMNELGKAKGLRPEDMPVTTFRPPVKPVKMGLLLNDGGSDDE